MKNRYADKFDAYHSGKYYFKHVRLVFFALAVLTSVLPIILSAFIFCSPDGRFLPWYLMFIYNFAVIISAVMAFKVFFHQGVELKKMDYEKLEHPGAMILSRLVLSVSIVKSIYIGTLGTAFFFTMMFSRNNAFAIYLRTPSLASVLVGILGIVVSLLIGYFIVLLGKFVSELILVLLKICDCMESKKGPADAEPVEE